MRPSLGSGRGRLVPLRPPGMDSAESQMGAAVLEGQAYSIRRRRKKGLPPPLFGARYKLLAYCNLYRRPFGEIGKHTPRSRRGSPGKGQWAVPAGSEGGSQKTSEPAKRHAWHRIPATALGGPGALFRDLTRACYSRGGLPAKPAPLPVHTTCGVPPSRGRRVPFYRIMEHE